MALSNYIRGQARVPALHIHVDGPSGLNATLRQRFQVRHADLTIVVKVSEWPRDAYAFAQLEEFLRDISREAAYALEKYAPRDINQETDEVPF